jgi:HEAT repeat protein
VRSALADQRVFKDVLRRLETLPPSENASLTVIKTHDRGDVGSWMAAALLGRVRHRFGYVRVLEILDANDAQANSWAADALVRIVGRDSELDLARVIDEVDHGIARKSAALALGSLGSESSIAILVRALERGRLRALSVAQALCNTHVEPSVLVRALASPALEARRWPPMLIAARLRSRDDESAGELARCASSEDLRATLAAALRDDTEQVTWRADREAIQTWLGQMEPGSSGR